MKLELDLGQPASLLRVKAELEAALAAVNGAIAVRGTISEKPDEPARLAVGSSDPAKDMFLGLLPEDFDTGKALSTGRECGLPDYRVRRLLRVYVENGMLGIRVQGSGRRQTEYRKKQSN